MPLEERAAGRGHGDGARILVDEHHPGHAVAVHDDVPSHFQSFRSTWRWKSVCRCRDRDRARVDVISDQPRQPAAVQIELPSHTHSLPSTWRWNTVSPAAAIAAVRGFRCDEPPARAGAGRARRHGVPHPEFAVGVALEETVGRRGDLLVCV